MKEKFRVTKINDPFLNEFLEEHEAKDKFIKNCNRNYDNIPFIVTEEEKEGSRRDAERENVYIDVIADSFPWDYTPEGEGFWEKLHFLFKKEKVIHMWKISGYVKICLN